MLLYAVLSSTTHGYRPASDYRPADGAVDCSPVSRAAPKEHVFFWPSNLQGSMLHVFLPDESAKPQASSEWLRTSCMLGIPTVGLDLSSLEPTHSLSRKCSTRSAACWPDAQRDLLWGGGSSGVIDVATQDSISGLLLGLLEGLGDAYPTAAWLTRTGQRTRVAWDRVIVSGSARGGTQALTCCYN